MTSPDLPFGQSLRVRGTNRVYPRDTRTAPIQTVSLILAALATVVGACGSLMLFVLLLAGSPNSSPEQIRLIKWLMLLCAVAGLLCFGGGIFLTARAHPALASLVGALPMIVLVSLMIWVEVSH